MRPLPLTLIAALGLPALAPPARTQDRPPPRGARGALLNEAPGEVPAAPRPLAERVTSFAYQLQGADPERLARTQFDLLVIDPTREGGEDTRLTPAEVQKIRAGKPGRVLLAYFSLGEAETYRPYWQTGWAPGKPGSPAWLGPENPAWKGNYKVRYWDPSWRQLLWGNEQAQLDRLLAAGFDGIFLDVIDAFEFWGPGGESRLERQSAERDMVELVQALAAYARQKRPGFLVMPQNGEALLRHPDYLKTIDGIAVEDLYYDGEKQVAPATTARRAALLGPARQAGKAVLVTDYARKPERVRDLYARARAAGFVAYATNRDLDRITLNPGLDPPDR